MADTAVLVDFDEKVEAQAKAIFANHLGWPEWYSAVNIAWEAANQEWYRRVVRDRAARMVTNGGQL